MPIRTLIIDDEPLARERIKSLLADDPEVCVAGVCGDGKAAVRMIARKAPDLVFLDIQLPELDGFEIIEALGGHPLPAIIFVTAYDKYALQAFKVHAVDYLLKPVSRPDLKRALDYFRRHRHGENHLRERMTELMRDLEAQRAQAGRLILKTEGEVFCLKPAEIDWIESAGNYVCFHVGAKTHISRETMNQVEEKLQAHNFVRIHRSAIVNFDRIRKLKPQLYGDYLVELQDGTRLTMSRGYRRAVLSRIGS